MLFETVNPAPSTAIDYICVPADQLSRMTSELRNLDSSNTVLTLAMATAGHDLRQRLHRLLGTVELLSRSEEPTRSADLSGEAKTQIYQLAGKLEQLTLLANRDFTHPVPCPSSLDIASFLGQVCEEWRPQASAKYLGFRVSYIEAFVQSDQHLLSVIVNNLLSNAVRYTSTGDIGVDCIREGRYIMLMVKDTGPGISEENLRRSFDCVPRLGELNRGLGLGLSIVRRTAELLGHEVAVSSNLDQGTCVSVRIPLAKELGGPSLIA